MLPKNSVQNSVYWNNDEIQVKLVYFIDFSVHSNKAELSNHELSSLKSSKSIDIAPSLDIWVFDSYFSW